MGNFFSQFYMDALKKQGKQSEGHSDARDAEIDYSRYSSGPGKTIKKILLFVLGFFLFFMLMICIAE